jgi:hypothetical protein
MAKKELGLGPGPGPDVRPESSFLGNISSGVSGKSREEYGESGGIDRADAGPSDAGSIDTASIATNAPKRRKARGPWSDAEREAHAQGRAGKKERVAVEAEPIEFADSVIMQMAQGIAFIHAMLAVGMQSPEMNLTEAEALGLAKAFGNVGKHYIAVEVNSKLGAWSALLLTCGAIYIPKLMRRDMRMNEEKKAKTSPSPVQPPTNSVDSVPREMMQ